MINFSGIGIQGWVGWMNWPFDWLLTRDDNLVVEFLPLTSLAECQVDVVRFALDVGVFNFETERS